MKEVDNCSRVFRIYITDYVLDIHPENLNPDAYYVIFIGAAFIDKDCLKQQLTELRSILDQHSISKVLFAPMCLTLDKSRLFEVSASEFSVLKDEVARVIEMQNDSE